jgi:hypothetical protein
LSTITVCFAASDNALLKERAVESTDVPAPNGTMSLKGASADWVAVYAGIDSSTANPSEGMRRILFKMVDRQLFGL